MIEIYFKDSEVKNIDSYDENEFKSSSILSIRCIEINDFDLQQLANRFDLDLTSFKKQEDIEISSHYVESEEQLSLSFTIPSYSLGPFFEEKDIHILIKNKIVFTFIPRDIEESFNQLTRHIYGFKSPNLTSNYQLLVFQIGIISDYFADIVELISKKIKELFQKTLKSKQFKETDLDYITELRFNNLLVRESLSEFQRIILLMNKSNNTEGYAVNKLSAEIEDLTVISEYIQYNFNRLEDLTGNINSKIELEQNRIFKILTIITVCISLPTLIVGIYGMNFKHMPELEWLLGYPIIVLVLILSFLIPLIYFKRKKWF
jgi:magnesium transporter